MSGCVEKRGRSKIGVEMWEKERKKRVITKARCGCHKKGGAYISLNTRAHREAAIVLNERGKVGDWKTQRFREGT